MGFRVCLEVHGTYSPSITVRRTVLLTVGYKYGYNWLISSMNLQVGFRVWGLGFRAFILPGCPGRRGGLPRAAVAAPRASSCLRPRAGLLTRLSAAIAKMQVA